MDLWGLGSRELTHQQLQVIVFIGVVPIILVREY